MTAHLPTAEEFHRRWRDIALRDPGHATYPEAVPGFRRHLAATGRTGSGEGTTKRETISEPLRASEAITPDGPPDPIVRRDATTGGMIVHYPAAEPDVPPVDAEVVELEPLRQVFRDHLPALGNALTEFLAKPKPRRWWDPRGWWRR